MADRQWIVSCNDVHGRPRSVTVTINELGQVCVNMPMPGTGCLDWLQLDELQNVLAEARKRAPGPLSKPS